MSRFYGDFDPAATADTVIVTFGGFSWNTSINSSYYTFADSLTVQRSGSASWGYPAVSTGVFTEGKFSIDFRVNTVDSSTKRTNFGIVATSQTSIGGSNWLFRPFNSNAAHSAGVQDEGYSTGDIFTLNVNFDDKSLEVLQNNSIASGSSIGTQTFSTSGNFHIAIQEYSNTSTFEVVDQVYAPPAGFTKITPTGGVPSSTTDTRSHSHVWNYSDVYDARFAGTWPVFDTGSTTFSHIVRFDASMPGAVDTAAGSWTSVSGTNHPTTLVNGTTATLLIADQNGLNVVRTNTSFVVTSADQVSTVTSNFSFAMVYSRNVTTSAQNIYPFGTGPGNNANSLGIEIHSSNTGGDDFDVAGGNSYDRTVSVAGVDFQSADYTRYLIMASANSSDGIHNAKVQVRGGTSSAVTLGTSGSNRATAPRFLDSTFKTGAFSGAQQLDICEMIFYDVALSSAELITEADRLATKWGL
jgi:hypothetical protein